jgi:hypothetical protein
LLGVFPFTCKLSNIHITKIGFIIASLLYILGTHLQPSIIKIVNQNHLHSGKQALCCFNGYSSMNITMDMDLMRIDFVKAETSLHREVIYKLLKHEEMIFLSTSFQQRTNFEIVC